MASSVTTPASFPGGFETINGQPLASLAAETRQPYRALFIGRISRSNGYADFPLTVQRMREPGGGIQEQITVRNHSTKPAKCLIALSIDADFADLFEVKEARIQRRWDQHARQPVAR